MTSAEKTLLIVEDDEILGGRLRQSLGKRGFDVTLAHSVADAAQLAQKNPPRYALIDLRLADGNGLDVVRILRECRPDARIVVLTGYGNIATAVAAIKVGAVDYLAKPVDADQIVAALMNADNGLPPPPPQPMSPDRVKWEHIQRVFHQCNGNVSQTARQLNMHRRTLQRILQKHAPLEKNNGGDVDL